MITDNGLVLAVAIIVFAVIVGGPIRQRLMPRVKEVSCEVLVHRLPLPLLALIPNAVVCKDDSVVLTIDGQQFWFQASGEVRYHYVNRLKRIDTWRKIPLDDVIDWTAQLQTQQQVAAPAQQQIVANNGQYTTDDGRTFVITGPGTVPSGKKLNATPKDYQLAVAEFNDNGDEQLVLINTNTGDFKFDLRKWLKDL